MSTQQEIKNVTLVGAGNMGGIILSGLLEAPDFNVTVLSRPSSKTEFPKNVTVKRVEYTESELAAALKGQDAVVSAVGGAAVLDQKTLIDAAIKAGVKRFLPSEYSSNTLPDAVRELVPVFQYKMEVLDYLKAKESSGLTWTGISVGAVFDWCLKIGFLGFDLNSKKAQIWDDGNTLFSSMTAEDLGKTVVSALRNFEGTKNQYIHVCSLTACQNDILSALETTTGTKWQTERVSTSSQIAQAQDLLGKGDLNGMFDLAKASMWSNKPGLRQNFEKDESLANAKVGLEKRSLEAVIKAAL